MHKQIVECLRPGSQATLDARAWKGLNLREIVARRCDDHRLDKIAWNEGCIFRLLQASCVANEALGLRGQLRSPCSCLRALTSTDDRAEFFPRPYRSGRPCPAHVCSQSGSLIVRQSEVLSATLPIRVVHLNL